MNFVWMLREGKRILSLLNEKDCLMLIIQKKFQDNLHEKSRGGGEGGVRGPESVTGPVFSSHMKIPNPMHWMCSMVIFQTWHSLKPCCTLLLW